MACCFVRMQPIYVQECDGAVAKLRNRIVKAGSQQVGKLTVMTLVVLSYVLENFFPVMSGVFVSQPVVDRVTNRAQATLFHRLAECEISLSPMCAQFNDQLRMSCSDEIICECQMAGPTADISGLITSRYKPGQRQSQSANNCARISQLQDSRPSLCRLADLR